jgi:hypothetical protein
MRVYDGHAGGHCTKCHNNLSLNDCDAMGLGLYERAFTR